MTEVPVMFHRSTDSPEVTARLAVAGETAHRNMEAINARMAPHLDEYNQRLDGALYSKKPTHLRIAKLWSLADDVMALAKGHAACRRGCSHCCHIAVAVSPSEAKLIGMRIGRTPAKPATAAHASFKHFSYGYHNPCTFLKNNECSIYENRPLACRTHANLDQDELLCKLTPPHSITVPLMNNEVLIQAQALIAVETGEVYREGTEVYGYSDIREWFP